MAHIILAIGLFVRSVTAFALISTVFLIRITANHIKQFLIFQNLILHKASM